MIRPRHWWWFASGLILTITAYGALSRSHAFAITAFSNIIALILLLTAMFVMLANGISSRGATRGFWILMAGGFGLWVTNQVGWTLFEVVVRHPLPDPFFGDALLFLHVVPFMAAVTLRPHRTPHQKSGSFGGLNTLMLLLWWVFIYGFVVFPEEYLSLNAPVYTRSYDLLYLIESLMYLAIVGLAALNARGDWKRLYLQLFGAAALYAANSQAMNAAIIRGTYYSGGWYDLAYMASLCWFIWIGLSSRRLRLEPYAAESGYLRWATLLPKLAMLAILSLPLLALWTTRYDTAPANLREFRLLITLVAMLVLGAVLFLKQYLLDQKLTRLLSDSNQSFDNLQRLQTELVQKEKLASLGQLVAGAAHEINNPLAAILGYSELLSTSETLSPEQSVMARKIGQQARRTRDLVADLLSFAQQTPAEKVAVDLGMLLNRAVQIELLRLDAKKIRLQTHIDSALPRVWGNTNQLFQACVQLIANAIDALEEVGGGTLTIGGRREGNEVVLEFADTGPGMREPAKVFDPFYTTKPIGKGTGLGLSATYGVVQNHQGQITCCNKPEGGALFMLRFPITQQAPLAAAASES
jgi:signal transduction histidine kinase